MHAPLPLSVRNLAVIDRLELEFAPGFNVLTGETGAGKSILVGAVGLLVGGRASAELVRTGEETAAVEAVFERPDGREVIVRREVSSQGRSRAFVDGALVTSAALREAAGSLVDLHGQHEHQVLLDPAAHLDLLDEFAGLTPIVTAWPRRSAPGSRCATSGRVSPPAEQQKASRAEFLTFQLAEIDKGRAAAGRRRGADHDAAGARQRRPAAAAVRRRLRRALRRRRGRAAGARRRCGSKSASSPRSTPSSRRTSRRATRSSRSSRTSRSSCASYSQNIDASPARLQEIEDRLALLERLKKKHGPALADVIAKAADAAPRAARPRARDRARRRARRRAGQGGAPATLRVAGALSTKRRGRREGVLDGAREGARRPRDGQDAVRGPVRRTAGKGRWSERGLDEAEFYISPNPGEDVKPLARIASGGELSRIMLALKTLASTDAARQDAHLRRGRRRHRRGSRGRRRRAPPAARRSGSRSCASRTCRRSPPTARRTTRLPRA